uniref:Uncharacterized protein n=1 Tax=Arundo donax TaxID=35708 RepID=A0A0A9BZM2_ARUDO
MMYFSIKNLQHFPQKKEHLPFPLNTIYFPPMFKYPFQKCRVLRCPELSAVLPGVEPSSVYLFIHESLSWLGI